MLRSLVSRRLVWWMLLACWTIALLLPRPDRQLNESFGVASAQWTGYAVHVTVYALFCIGCFMLESSHRRAALWVGVLSLHAFASEAAQTLTSYRHGSWRDVGLDHIGIFAGVTLYLSLERLVLSHRRAKRDARLP